MTYASVSTRDAEEHRSMWYAMKFVNDAPNAILTNANLAAVLASCGRPPKPAEYPFIRRYVETLAAELRRYFSIGTQTRRYRADRDYGRCGLHQNIIAAIMNAARYPGYYVERTQDALHAGYGAALAYEKHVRGYRIDGTLARHISEMSPWQFANLLGRMVDAGVTCTGDGERFFTRMARDLHAVSAS